LHGACVVRLHHLTPLWLVFVAALGVGRQGSAACLVRLEQARLLLGAVAGGGGSCSCTKPLRCPRSLQSSTQHASALCFQHPRRSMGRPTRAHAGKYPYDLEDDVEVSQSSRSQMMLERMEQERYPLPSRCARATAEAKGHAQD